MTDVLVGFEVESKKPEFKKAFFEWFDSLDPQTRKKYTEHKHGGELADMYFFNRIWKK